VKQHYDLYGNKVSQQRYWEIRHLLASTVIAQDQIGPMTISTVWVGYDVAPNDEFPMIFETACVDGPLDSDTMYASTYLSALLKHQLMCARAEEALLR
jgi:hypothetical protein